MGSVSETGGEQQEKDAEFLQQYYLASIVFLLCNLQATAKHRMGFGMLIIIC